MQNTIASSNGVDRFLRAYNQKLMFSNGVGLSNPDNRILGAKIGEIKRIWRIGALFF